MRIPAKIAGFIGVLVLLEVALARPGRGQPLPAQAVPTQPEPSPDPSVKMVLTYYGLRKLEQDPKISDEEKRAEWEVFITRATDQIDYARKAVARWKNAAQVRLLDAIDTDDRNTALSAPAKMERWKDILRRYPKSSEAKRAEKRIEHWSGEETKRLVEAAREMERGRGSKVERIRAWSAVLGWANKGKDASAAMKRVHGLRLQLFTEAESVDKIERIDRATRLAAWQDVLAGEPSDDQRRTATQRVQTLEAELSRDSADAKEAEESSP